MPQNADVRVLDDPQQTVGHLRGLHVHVAVNTRDHNVELRQDFVIDIHAPVLQDVDFTARENREVLELLGNLPDFLDLIEQPLLVEAVRHGERLRVIRDGNMRIAPFTAASAISAIE